MTFKKYIMSRKDTVITLFEKDWLVKEDGTMCHKGKESYEISSCDLKDCDWISHMMEKGWCDLNTFIPAYFYALSKIGVEYLPIKIAI